jgi:hypothetical protein
VRSCRVRNHYVQGMVSGMSPSMYERIKSVRVDRKSPTSRQFQT